MAVHCLLVVSCLAVAERSCSTLSMQLSKNLLSCCLSSRRTRRTCCLLGGVGLVLVLPERCLTGSAIGGVVGGKEAKVLLLKT